MYDGTWQRPCLMWSYHPSNVLVSLVKKKLENL